MTDTDKEPGTNVSDTAEPRTTEPDAPAGETPEEETAEPGGTDPEADGDTPRDEETVADAEADDVDEGDGDGERVADDPADDPDDATEDAGDETDDGDEEVQADPSRPSGRVKVFDEERNYGFLQPLEGGRDIFVHASEVEDGTALRPGDVVEYDLTKTDDGSQATSVRILERAPEDNPAGRVVTGGAPPTWDQLERIQRDMRHQRRQRRRRR